MDQIPLEGFVELTERYGKSTDAQGRSMLLASFLALVPRKAQTAAQAHPRSGAMGGTL